MSIVNLKDFKASLNKPKYTTEPKQGRNLYSKNLRDKIEFFNKKIGPYLSNPIIENCEFSAEGCAIKFISIKENTDVLLILQDFSPDEFDNSFVTWEFFIHNIKDDEYLDSRFFTATDMAVNYFLSKIKYMF
tara:strand:+ start:256 stop:651 length:396 start_codon:yes stop_codon:yes gene_type:complete